MKGKITGNQEDKISVGIE